MKISMVLVFSLLCGFFKLVHGAEVAYQNYMLPPQQLEILETEGRKYVKEQKIFNETRIVLLVDRSGSMLNVDDYPLLQFQPSPPPSNYVNPYHPNNLWKRMDSAFMMVSHLFAKALYYDVSKEIPVYFFGKNVAAKIINNVEDLYYQFGVYAPAANETTNLYDALKIAFKNNIVANKRTLFIVVTDGEPNGDRKKIKKLIYEKLAKIDKKGERLNILFVRVGDDPKAIEFLRYLDEDCKKIKKNVDTKTDNWIYTQPFEAVVLEAILENRTCSALNF